MNLKELTGKELLYKFNEFHGNFILAGTGYEEMYAAQNELLSRLSEGEAATNRYEYIRALTPRDFSGIYSNCLQGENFDKLVDDLIEFRKGLK